MLNSIVANEQGADLGELLAQKWFATRQVEILELAELGGQPRKFIERQIVALIQVAPVEAMLAGQIADRIDEYDQEWRRSSGRVTQGPKRETTVT